MKSQPTWIGGSISTVVCLTDGVDVWLVSLHRDTRQEVVHTDIRFDISGSVDIKNNWELFQGDLIRAI